MYIIATIRSIALLGPNLTQCRQPLLRMLDDANDQDLRVSNVRVMKIGVLLEIEMMKVALYGMQCSCSHKQHVCSIAIDVYPRWTLGCAVSDTNRRGSRSQRVYAPQATRSDTGHLQQPTLARACCRDFAHIKEASHTLNSTHDDLSTHPHLSIINRRTIPPDSTPTLRPDLCTARPKLPRGECDLPAHRKP